MPFTSGGKHWDDAVNQQEPNKMDPWTHVLGVDVNRGEFDRMGCEDDLGLGGPIRCLYSSTLDDVVVILGIDNAKGIFIFLGGTGIISINGLDVNGIINIFLLMVIDLERW